MTIKSEAEEILDFFSNELGMTIEGEAIRPGLYVDGLKAADWMQKRNIPSWKELEWPGFFIKHIAQDFFENHKKSKIKPFTEGKKYRLKGEYLWDIRFHDVDKDPLIILIDASDFENDIKQYNGMGIIIINAVVIPDKDDKFRLEIEEMKGGLSEYEKKRRAEGIEPRQRKAGFYAYWGIAYFISPEDILGNTDTWLMSNFQKNMRNSDDKPRNAKYIIDMENVPDEKIIAKSNFNMDPEDYKEFFT